MGCRRLSMQKLLLNKTGALLIRTHMKKFVLTLTLTGFALGAAYAGDQACTDGCCAKTQAAAKDQCCQAQQAHKKSARKEFAGRPVLKSPKAAGLAS